MDRRRIFTAAAAGLAGIASAFTARGANAQAEQAARAQKAVYHVADADKAHFTLGNLRNHLDGAPGVRLAVVVHGPALNAFRATTLNPDFRQAMREAVAAGVAFHACGRTMAAMKLAPGDLLPGFEVAAQGGVVLLADLQAQGWAYLRP